MIRWWRRMDTSTRVLAATAAIGCVVALATAGFATWLVVDPQYWLPGAYAEKGERGDPGPRGPRGPRGAPGPVGPSAEEAISEVEAAFAELEARVADAEDAIGYVGDLKTAMDDLMARVDSLEWDLESVCDETEASFRETGLFSYFRLGCPIY